MKRGIAILCWSLAVSGVAESAELLCATNCPKTDAAPTIDGELNDACWDQASVIDKFGVLCSYDKPIGLPPTSCRLLYDDTHLYVGGHFAEPNMAGLNEHVYNKSIKVHWRDCAEVFMDAEHGRYRYFKLFANPINENNTYRVWDDGWGRYWDNLWGKMEKVRIKAKMLADGWAFEMAIPWSSVKHKPETGDVIGFNLNRFRFVGTEKGRHRFFTWSARGGTANNDAQHFGHVVLGPMPEPIEKLVAVCFPDYGEREIVVPLPDRMVVFDHGQKRVHLYTDLKREAETWFEEKEKEAAALLSEDQRSDPALKPLLLQQNKLAQQLGADRERFRAVEAYDVGTASDFSAVQLSVRGDLEHLREMTKVAQLIKEVQAEASREKGPP